MPYCSECGVELERSAHRCPLCGTQVHSNTAPPPGEQVYAQSDSIEDVVERRPSGYGRMLAVQILSLVFIIPALITLVVNWVLSARFDWSLYVVAAMAISWVITVVPILLYRNLVLVLSVCILAVSLFLWVVDTLDTRAAWFWTIGMPILVVLVAITAIVTAVSLISKRRGANIASYVLMGIVVFSGAVDALSQRYSGVDALSLGWSLVVAAALLPISVFLLYYHIFLSGRINLRKQLHM